MSFFIARLIYKLVQVQSKTPGVKPSDHQSLGSIVKCGYS